MTGTWSLHRASRAESSSTDTLTQVAPVSAATREMLYQSADAIAAGLKTTVIERGSVVTRGEDCYRAVMESDEGRAEMRIFTTSSVILSALYIQGSAWDAGAADRTRFFESVVVP